MYHSFRTLTSITSISMRYIKGAAVGEEYPKTTGYKRKVKSSIHIILKLEITSIAIKYIPKQILFKTVFSSSVSPQNTPGTRHQQTPEQPPPPNLSSTQSPRTSKQPQSQDRLASRVSFCQTRRIKLVQQIKSKWRSMEKTLQRLTLTLWRLSWREWS